jgi:hypothetical protein
MGASARSGAKHVIGVRRPVPCQDQALSETQGLRRPRSLSVPPGRPIKATGSPPKRVRVRLRLGGRAASRRTFNTIASSMSAGPGRGPIKGAGSGTVAYGDRRGSMSHEVLFGRLLGRARPWCAPVRPRVPRTGPAWFVVNASLYSVIAVRFPFPFRRKEGPSTPGLPSCFLLVSFPFLSGERDERQTGRRDSFQKRPSSKATFLVSM